MSASPVDCYPALDWTRLSLVHEAPDMSVFNIHEAKTQFSRLIERVAEGEEIIIAKAGKPVARLVPADKPAGPRTLGILHGKLKIPDDFDRPLPADVIASFEQG